MARQFIGSGTCEDNFITNKLPTLAVIGPGKVGTSVGILAARAGYPVNAVGLSTQRKHPRSGSATRQGGACRSTELRRSRPVPPSIALVNICFKQANSRLTVAGATFSNLITLYFSIIRGVISNKYVPFRTGIR